MLEKIPGHAQTTDEFKRRHTRWVPNRPSSNRGKRTDVFIGPVAGGQGVMVLNLKRVDSD